MIHKVHERSRTLQMFLIHGVERLEAVLFETHCWNCTYSLHFHHLLWTDGSIIVIIFTMEHVFTLRRKGTFWRCHFVTIFKFNWPNLKVKLGSTCPLKWVGHPCSTVSILTGTLKKSPSVSSSSFALPSFFFFCMSHTCWLVLWLHLYKVIILDKSVSEEPTL